jgi:hypothetical protein
MFMVSDWKFRYSLYLNLSLRTKRPDNQVYLTHSNLNTINNQSLQQSASIFIREIIGFWQSVAIAHCWRSIYVDSATIICICIYVADADDLRVEF